MIFGRSAFLAAAAATIAVGAQAPPAARAAPAHEALVIGNGTYDSLPPLRACLLSAHAVSAALRNAGFEVVEREDATSGGTDGAIGETGRHLAAAPGATAFVYVCAYATAFSGRAFLLPTSADITRPADVLTQGVLARSLLEMLAGGGVRSAVVALDVVPAPGAPTTLDLGAAMQGNLPDGLGSIAVSQAKPPDAPTPLAASLVANLKPTTLRIAPLLAAVQRQLAADKALTIAAIHVPAASSYLVGAPTPAASASPPPAMPAAAAMPAEAQMTDADRRRVQTALARLGYYDGQVDGVFGPDTRAAIRRYQHELRAAMTGRLTEDQASRLVGGSRGAPKGG
ncbi:MAG TPA: peptidoglycan-binding protein [Acetobacteraceae bacterium]|nr:peptidoglycan-binding protein [Acetobacteraceae bacterium]